MTQAPRLLVEQDGPILIAKLNRPDKLNAMTQAIMLLLREEGLNSCPQEFLSLCARLIKAHIGVDVETQVFFCGLAIGYRDEAAPVNGHGRPRVSLERQVRLLGF